MRTQNSSWIVAVSCFSYVDVYATQQWNIHLSEAALLTMRLLVDEIRVTFSRSYSLGP